MSTSATIKIIQADGTELRILQSHDGMPDFVKPAILEALEETAGELPEVAGDAFKDNYRDAVSRRYHGHDAGITNLYSLEQARDSYWVDYRYVVCLAQAIVVGSDDLI